MAHWCIRFLQPILEICIWEKENKGSPYTFLQEQVKRTKSDLYSAVKKPGQLL